MSVTYGKNVLITGVGSDWVYQSSTTNPAKKEATTINGDGNIAMRSVFDEIESITETYRAKAAAVVTPALTLPDLGSKDGDYIVTGIKVDTANDGQGALLSLTAHKHIGGTNDTPTMKVATGIAALVTSATGAINFTGGTGTIIQGSIEATCQHAEVKDGSGNNLGGENHTAEMTFTGTFTDGGTVGAGWTALQTDPGIAASNTDWQTRTITAKKSLTLAAA